MIFRERTLARRILVVEDNLDLADLLVMHLCDAGHAVRKASDGHGALKRLEDGPFDLVILDLMLLDLDGLDICRRLRTRPDYLPILMLTARSTECSGSKSAQTTISPSLSASANCWRASKRCSGASTRWPKHRPSRRMCSSSTG
jgi:CheY-like chemotaxis protein